MSIARDAPPLSARACRNASTAKPLLLRDDACSLTWSEVESKPSVREAEAKGLPRRGPESTHWDLFDDVPIEVSDWFALVLCATYALSTARLKLILFIRGTFEYT